MAHGKVAVFELFVWKSSMVAKFGRSVVLHASASLTAAIPHSVPLWTAMDRPGPIRTHSSFTMRELMLSLHREPSTSTACTCHWLMRRRSACGPIW